MSTIKIRTQAFANYTELKVLLTHPMQNGRFRDPENGELISAHHIQELTIQLNEQKIATIEMGGSISQNPFFGFRLKQALTGDKIRVTWRDNLGISDSAEYVIEADHAQAKPVTQ